MNCKVEEMFLLFVNYDYSNWDEYLVYMKGANSSLVNATSMFTTFYLSYGADTVTIAMDLVSSPNPTVNDFLHSIQNFTEDAKNAIERFNQSTAEWSKKIASQVSTKLETYFLCPKETPP